MKYSQFKAARFVRLAKPVIQATFKQFIPAKEYDKVGEAPEFWAPGPDDRYKAEGTAIVDGKSIHAKGETLTEAKKDLEAQVQQLQPGAQTEEYQIDLVRI